VALIDVVKWDHPGDQLVWKFPSSELSTMTQLIVNESQVAILFKGGARCDIFGPGRHTLSTGNIPILNKLVNLPFGGRSPFSAEVWFVNKTIPLNLKFGTSTPLQLEDPTYQIVVPVRAFGQFGLQITDPGLFVHALIGANTGMDQATLVDYLKGILTSRLKSRIAQAVVRERIGVLEIETMLDEISIALERSFAPDYAEYGLTIRSFRIMSISVPPDDTSVVELKRAKASAARRRIEGTSYAQERQFDVLQTSAGNEGAGGAFASIGTGFGVGQSVTQFSQQAFSSGPVPGAPPAAPPPWAAPPFGAPVALFHVVIEGQPSGPHALEVLRQGVASGHVTPQTPVWRAGMASWTPAGAVADLAALFSPPPFFPPPAGPPPFGGSA
jgi:membrane protease subunit (stomatin/prohibitin family)